MLVHPSTRVAHSQKWHVRDGLPAGKNLARMSAILDTALESKWHVRAEAMSSTMPDANMHLYRMELDCTRCAK